MPNPLLETVLGLTSIHIALGGAVVSVLSFLVAVRLAWLNKFSPPRLIGVFPFVVLYTFSKPGDSGPDDSQSDFFLVPSFWLTNTGARSMLVEDVRLVIAAAASTTLTLYPTHTIPLTAIDAPNTFNDYELLRVGMAPFSGFSVAPAEKWVNNLAFALTSAERKTLHKQALVTVEVRPVGRKQFKRVTQQCVAFGHGEFSWLQWMGIGGPSADYFYATDWRKPVPNVPKPF